MASSNSSFPNSSSKIIYNIENKNIFAEILKQNPGVIIIKFGAEWCRPCKMIESDVVQYMEKMPSNIQCYIIDVDESIELYGFLKQKRMINGIPAIFGYYQGNLSYIPDDTVVGADKPQIRMFFERCIEHLQRQS
jgi:thiol-disulfide isomerase/thioredoxin